MERGKIICTAEYQSLPDGNFSVAYDNKTYAGFYLVEHEPSAGNEIFQRIHRSTATGFADCFPPVVASTKYVLVHRITGTDLRTWIQTSTDLVHTDPQQNLIQMTDKLKLIIQDLGFVVLHGIESGIKMYLSSDRIYLSNCQPPRVSAIAASLSQDDNASLKGLTSLFNEIWTQCGLEKNNEACLITRLLGEGRTKSSIQQFLCSPTFWTKHIRIYTLIRLGEIVTSVKEGVVKSLKRPQDVLQWRTLFSFDPKLKLLVGQAPKNKFQGQQQHMSYDGTEIDCGIRFLSDTLAHFERMCKAQTGLSDRVEMIQYYDLHFPKMMNALYEVIELMENTFRR